MKVKPCSRIHWKAVIICCECVLLTLLLSGCWDVQELKDSAFIIGMGIDVHDKGIELSLLEVMTDPLAEGEGQGSTVSGNANTRVVSASGPTIAHCIEILRGEMEKRISLSKIRFIAFNEDVLKKGIRHHMNFVIRHNEVDKVSYVVATKQSARELLKGEKGMLYPFLKIERQSPLLHTVKTWEMVPQLLTEREGTIMPLIQLGEDKIENLGASLLSLEKQVLTVNPEMVRSINILRDRNVKKTKWIIGDELAFEFRRVRTKWHVERNRVVIRVKLNGWIIQSKTLDPLKKRVNWEHRLAMVIAKDLKKVLQLTQEHGVDILGVGEKFRQKNWDTSNWSERFKELTFDIEVDVKILSGYGESK